MPVIEIKTINLGGIADSALMGGANSVAQMIGLDIHSRPGFIRINQKLTTENATIIDDFVKTAVACSDGNTYLFGSNLGKIWRRDSGGNYTLQATVMPSSGLPCISGSMEYEGYVYYAMEKKLGRWKIGTAWSTRDDDFGTFKRGNTETGRTSRSKRNTHP